MVAFLGIFRFRIPIEIELVRLVSFFRTWRKRQNGVCLVLLDHHSKCAIQVNLKGVQMLLVLFSLVPLTTNQCSCPWKSGECLWHISSCHCSSPCFSLS